VAFHLIIAILIGVANYQFFTVPRHNASWPEFFIVLRIFMRDRYRPDLKKL